MIIAKGVNQNGWDLRQCAKTIPLIMYHTKNINKKYIGQATPHKYLTFQFRHYFKAF